MKTTKCEDCGEDAIFDKERLIYECIDCGWRLEV